jgi:adenylate cyclase
VRGPSTDSLGSPLWMERWGAREWVYVLMWPRLRGRAMAGIRKLAAILASDVVGYSRLAGADEDRTLARLRALRSDLVDPVV